MSDDSIPVWTGAAEWARKLYVRLDELGEAYLSAATPHDEANEFTGVQIIRQNEARKALKAIIFSLHEIPGYKSSKGMAIISDLHLALVDLTEGRRPQLLEPTRAGSAGRDGSDRKYLKCMVVWAFRIMTEGHGWSETKAAKLVAEKFAAAGAKGRKGNRLSASSVIDWSARMNAHASDPSDISMYKNVEFGMDLLRRKPRWPGEVESSIQWIERMTAHPVLRSKYG